MRTRLQIEQDACKNTIYIPIQQLYCELYLHGENGNERFVKFILLPLMKIHRLPVFPQ